MRTAVWRRRDLASKRSDEYGKVTHFSVVLSTKKLRLDLFYRSAVAVSFHGTAPAWLNHLSWNQAKVSRQNLQFN